MIRVPQTNSRTIEPKIQFGSRITPVNVPETVAVSREFESIIQDGFEKYRLQ